MKLALLVVVALALVCSPLAMSLDEFTGQTEPCQWGEWEKAKDCDVCKEEAEGLTKYAIKRRPLLKGFTYPDREGFWKGTAEKIGNGPECFSHDMKENYAATKES